MTPREIFDFVKELSGLVLSLIAIGGWIVVWKTKAEAPNKTQDERLTKLEMRMDNAEEKLSRDYDRMNEYDKTLKLNLRAQLALISHALDGNQTDELTEVKKELTRQIFCSVPNNNEKKGE